MAGTDWAMIYDFEAPTGFFNILKPIEGSSHEGCYPAQALVFSDHDEDDEFDQHREIMTNIFIPT